MAKSDASDDLPPLPDYDNPPVPFWVAHGWWLAPASVALATIGLTLLAFPPFNLAEFAYAFAAPALLWAYRGVRFKVYAPVVLGAHAVAWTLLLGWLHHVTWVGLLLLGPVIGVWVGSWFLVAWWVIPRMVGLPTPTRLLALLGLAGAWVIIEWTRTWLLSGFPWLPLAASQWERASILQIAAYTGSGGVSFVLIAMNIGFAAYAHRLFFERARGLRRRSQEFFLALFLLIVCLSVHVQETINRGLFTRPLGRIGFVQPYIPQAVKWDPSHGPAIMDTLERTTLDVAARRPDLILWPEAVTPWAVRGDPAVEAWTENLVNRAGAPLLLGSIAVEPPEEPGDEPEWRNGAFLAEPGRGVATEYYAKRHLVPFGEFVPFRPLLGWIGKFVEIGGDFQAGRGPVLLPVTLADDVQLVSPLICYEDIFPSLARDSVRAGADIIAVLTNNAWYGEGGAAYQHAAHSVLRAVETRRPVLRVGNGGWSGWIDEFGNIRAEVRRVLRRTESGALQPVITTRPRDRDEARADAGTIYVRGSGVADVTRDSRWIDRTSFYVRHGDWFVIVCLGLLGMALVAVKIGRPVEPQE